MYNYWGSLGSTMSGLSSTGYYFDQIIGSVSPTVNFLYDNVLTNPIFFGLLLVILVLSLFTMGD